MRLHLVAVGRLRAGPERLLVDDYIRRFDRTARPLGLGPMVEYQVEDRNAGGKAAEAILLARALPGGARLVVLDERGSVEGSRDFAARLARWRDAGVADLAFVIGGADGVATDLRDRADHLLGLGPMVWPHLLVRVMLTEQLYRAATILGGGPYHRD